MKTIKVQIKGTTPLLMANALSMLEEKKEVSSSTKKANPMDAVEKLAYRDDNKMLYVPAEAIKGCMVNAASYVKFGKYAAKPMIAGSVRINPARISLGTKTYKVDKRTAVNRMKGRIVVMRPVVENWKIDFELVYDDEVIANAGLIKPILENGGKRVGILAFRPEKLGNFGMFEVTKWEEQ